MCVSIEVMIRIHEVPLDVHNQFLQLSAQPSHKGLRVKVLTAFGLERRRLGSGLSNWRLDPAKMCLGFKEGLAFRQFRLFDCERGTGAFALRGRIRTLQRLVEQARECKAAEDRSDLNTHASSRLRCRSRVACGLQWELLARLAEGLCRFRVGTKR